MLKLKRRLKDIQITLTLPWFRKRREVTDETRRKISAGLKRLKSIEK